MGQKESHISVKCRAKVPLHRNLRFFVMEPRPFWRWGRGPGGSLKTGPLLRVVGEVKPSPFWFLRLETKAEYKRQIEVAL